MRPGATRSIQNQNSNRWRGVHWLPSDQKRVVCKIPRSKHCWLPSSTAKASSIRNLFLQVNPLMPHFTRQFWTNCYSISGGFSQSCIGLENGWCSTIMPLHTVWSVCPIPGSEDGSCAWSPSLLPCHQRSCDSRFIIDSTGGLYWLFWKLYKHWKFVCIFCFVCFLIEFTELFRHTMYITAL